jgi:DNA-directed RNA polymerase subunit H (RpoH/RPB5)
MLKGLMTLLTGSRVSPEEKEQLISYYIKETQLTKLQDREAERYNTIVTQHGAHLGSPESVNALVDASHRLALCAKELIRRHVSFGPVPDRAGMSYAAWHVVYIAYDQWADAVHSTLTAISEGRIPFGVERVGEFFREMERQRRVAEREDKKMLKAAALRPSDLPRLIAGAYEASAASDWEPETDE